MVNWQLINKTESCPSHRLLFILVRIGLFSLLLAFPSMGQDLNNNPSLFVEVEHPILLLSHKPEQVCSTKLTVTPINFSPNAKLTYSWKQIQDVLSPNAAQMSEGKKILFSATGISSVNASFNDSGVYEIQVSVSDPWNRTLVSRNTWVNVWDARSPIIVDGKPDPLCPAPNVNPPTSVRNLSPDPGPYVHPRIFCTPSDWIEVKQRCTTGIIASLALKKLEEGLKGGIDSKTSAIYRLTRDLESYADSQYQDTGPDLTCGIQPEIKDGKSDWNQAWQNLIYYHSQLQDACFDAWIRNDPTQAHDDYSTTDQDRCRKLAKVVAALCHLHLSNCWDRQSGQFKKDYPLYITDLDDIGGHLPEFQHLALAYDFIEPWMTEEEKKETRNFLFAVSVGRATAARWFVPQVNGVWINHGIERGSQQNGDFINIEEEKIVTALCIAGEDKGVDPMVFKTFSSPVKPADFANSKNNMAYDWMQFTNANTGRDYDCSKPYPEGGNWPFARKVEVDNLQRAIWWNDDWYVSPWGFLVNKEAYYGFSAYGLWPAALAYARCGAFNMYVGSNFYQTSLHHLYCYYPGEIEQKSDHFSSHVYMYDNHDGGMDSRQVHAIFMKYMYPDDPLVDYVYAPYAVRIEQRLGEPFLTALFGLDPGLNGKPSSLPDLAQEKALPLTKVDPQIGVVVARSGWNEDDMMLYFDAGWPHTGHLHAEKNSFGFFALGRAWAISPGYHMKLNNFYSTVMIQDPAWAKDPVTEGYIGESESMEPEGSPYPKCHPTPPGRLIEVKESPDQLCTLMAGDAKAAYDFCFCGNSNPAYPEITPPWTRADFMYPGLLDVLLKRLPDPMNKEFLTGFKGNVGWDEKINSGYNPVKYAFRSILFVRGKHPYALVVDDIRKEDKPRNYRWMINCSVAFGGPDGKFADEKGNPVVSSMIMDPGATPSEATLLHLPDQGSQDGLPRLLVRDVSEIDNLNQPVMRMDTTKIWDVATDRLFIDRNGVVEPNYKILMYPYRTGEALPETTWNSDKTQLTVKTDGGATDVISFQPNLTDHRTRVTFRRVSP